MARAARQIRDFIESKKKKGSVAPKRDARFVTEGRKPAEHIHQDRWNADASEQPLGSHDRSQEAPKSHPPDARGPWRERVFKSTAKAPLYDEHVAGSGLEDTVGMQSPSQSSPPAAKSSKQPGRSELDVLEGRRRK